MCRSKHSSGAGKAGAGRFRPAPFRPFLPENSFAAVGGNKNGDAGKFAADGG